MCDEQPSKPSTSQRPTNLREHRRKTERNLVIGGFALLFLVGGALIWWLWGAGAMMTGWLCMGGGVALFGGLYLILKLMEIWSTSHSDQE